MFGSIVTLAIVGLASYYVRLTRKSPSHGATHDDTDSPLATTKSIDMRPPATIFSTYSLPVEILLVILSQSIEIPPLSRDRAGWFQRRFSLELSQVCAYWRAVMVENKTMWTDISVIWDQHTINLYHTRAGNLPVQYHLVMEGPSSARRAESWLLDAPVQKFIRPCSFASASSAQQLIIELQVGGWPGFGRGIIGDNLGGVLEQIDAPRLQALSISGIETPRLRITDAAFKGSEGLPALRTVSLTNVTVANGSAFFHSSLAHLSLYKVQVEWGTLNLLERLPNLLSLSISPLTVTLVTVSTKHSLPRLRSLALRGPTRDLYAFMKSLVYPQTCSVDLCLMETMGANLEKNTRYARGVFEALRVRLGPYGDVDIFNHLDMETDPFSVRLTFSQRTREHHPVPSAQKMVLSWVAFLPNRRFLLDLLLDESLPGMDYIRTITSQSLALDGGSEFPYHRDLWLAVTSRAPHLASCVLRGRAKNIVGFFDALEAVCTDSTLLRALEEVVLENVDLDVDLTSTHPTVLEAGSSFWTSMKRRSSLRVKFRGCYMPYQTEESLSHLGNVFVSPD